MSRKYFAARNRASALPCADADAVPFEATLDAEIRRRNRNIDVKNSSINVGTSGAGNALFGTIAAAAGHEQVVGAAPYRSAPSTEGNVVGFGGRDSGNMRQRTVSPDDEDNDDDQDKDKKPKRRGNSVAGRKHSYRNVHHDRVDSVKVMRVEERNRRGDGGGGGVGGGIKMTLSPPSSHGSGDKDYDSRITSPEEQRRLARILANRRSAKESRERTKRYMADLERSVEELTSRRDSLMQENRNLRAQIDVLSNVHTMGGGAAGVNPAGLATSDHRREVLDNGLRKRIMPVDAKPSGPSYHSVSSSSSSHALNALPPTAEAAPPMRLQQQQPSLSTVAPNNDGFNNNSNNCIPLIFERLALALAAECRKKQRHGLPPTVSVVDAATSSNTISSYSSSSSSSTSSSSFSSPLSSSSPSPVAAPTPAASSASTSATAQDLVSTVMSANLAGLWMRTAAAAAAAEATATSASAIAPANPTAYFPASGGGEGRTGTGGGGGMNGDPRGALLALLAQAGMHIS